jgi:hypothetical protein
MNHQEPKKAGSAKQQPLLIELLEENKVNNTQEYDDEPVDSSRHLLGFDLNPKTKMKQNFQEISSRTLLQLSEEDDASANTGPPPSLPRGGN